MVGTLKEPSNKTVNYREFKPMINTKAWTALL
jgi:hypothetical protein